MLMARAAAAAAVTVFVLLLTIAGPLPAAAAQPAPNPARTSLAESVGTIEPLDLLRVTVHDLAGPGVATTRLARVDRDGHARLPYWRPHKLAGLTTADAEAAAAKVYRGANLTHGLAIVTIARVEAGSRTKGLGGPVAKGDLLVVSLNDLTAPGRTDHLTVRVDPEAGTVHLPYVGAVAVAGSTEFAAADAIAKAYRDGRYIEHPTIWLLKTDGAAPVPEHWTRDEDDDAPQPQPPPPATPKRKRAK